MALGYEEEKRRREEEKVYGQPDPERAGILSGVQAMFTPGHTKQHTCFVVTAGNHSMCRIGDLSHHPVLLLERPRSQFIYDLDPLQAQRRG